MNIYDCSASPVENQIGMQVKPTGTKKGWKKRRSSDEEREVVFGKRSSLVRMPPGAIQNRLSSPDSKKKDVVASNQAAERGNGEDWKPECH